MKLRSLLLTLAPGAGLIAFGLLWEFYIRIFNVRATTLPAPSRIVLHMIEDWRFYLDNGRVTVTEAGLGLGLSFGVAMVLATVMVHSSFVERASWPVIILIQSTPVVVLAPVFLHWFGLGMTPKVLIAALFAFVPLLSNAFTGLRDVDADRLDLLHSVNASTSEIFWRLRLPHALPSLFAAGRACIALSLTGAVVGEFYGASTQGLGYQTKVAFTRLLIDQGWGSIFALAFIGISATVGLMAIERQVLRWHSPTSGDS